MYLRAKVPLRACLTYAFLCPIANNFLFNVSLVWSQQGNRSIDFSLPMQSDKILPLPIYD